MTSLLHVGRAKNAVILGNQISYIYRLLLGYGKTYNYTNRYPATQWPVLAFTGAPAPFPVQQQNTGLQKYLEWSDAMAAKRDDFIRDTIGNEKFLGIHLRLGSDFV